MKWQTQQISLAFIGTFVCFSGCIMQGQQRTVSERVSGRTFPSIFQAWNPIDMSTVPLETNRYRLRAAARHDLLWEEPVSQSGSGVELVLGAVWDHSHGGLATGFTNKSLRKALANRRAMLAMNPDMVFLREIRWKDAPGSFLPEGSDWWIKGEDGQRKAGWAGGPEPYYCLNYKNPQLRQQIALQAKVAVESNIYDGIMLDSWGSYGENEPGCIDLLRGIRGTIGPDRLIIVNNDRIAPLPNSAPFINGAFMEQTSSCHDSPEKWRKIKEQLLWFESNLAKPVTNCLEIQTQTPADMRAGLALSLVYSNGYYLFAQDDNRNPAPDHLHDWFGIYDVKLGGPVSKAIEPDGGASQRQFDNGMVAYNPMGNGPVQVLFKTPHRRASNNHPGKSFVLIGGDGDIFLQDSPDD